MDMSTFPSLSSSLIVARLLESLLAPAESFIAMELDERAELDELAMDGLGEEDFSSDVKSPFNSPSSKDSESLPQSLAVPAEPEPTATLTDESMDELTDELTDETVALNELVEDFFDNGMDFTSSSRDCAMDNRPCNMAISLSLTKGCEDNLLEIFSLELMVTILQCNGNSVVVTKSNDNIVISFRVRIDLSIFSARGNQS